MKLLLQNRQTELRLQTAAVRKLAYWLIARWPELKPLPTWNEIALIVTNDNGITPANLATFGKGEPTDVISLTYRGLPGETSASTGEIFVNAGRAHAIGRTAQGTGREMALYIAHGLHHLAGASDRTAALRRAMLNEEKAWLSKAEKAGMLKEFVHL
jgi:rRNA maturation RNase YbeY